MPVPPAEEAEAPADRGASPRAGTPADRSAPPRAGTSADAGTPASAGAPSPGAGASANMRASVDAGAPSSCSGVAAEAAGATRLPRSSCGSRTSGYGGAAGKHNGAGVASVAAARAGVAASEDAEDRDPIAPTAQGPTADIEAAGCTVPRAVENEGSTAEVEAATCTSPAVTRERDSAAPTARNPTAPDAETSADAAGIAEAASENAENGGMASLEPSGSLAPAAGAPAKGAWVMRATSAEEAPRPIGPSPATEAPGSTCAAGAETSAEETWATRALSEDGTFSSAGAPSVMLAPPEEEVPGSAQASSAARTLSAAGAAWPAQSGVASRCRDAPCSSVCGIWQPLPSKPGGKTIS